jgi:hypothetical protein
MPLQAYGLLGRSRGNECKQTLWPQSTSQLYRQSDRRLSTKLLPTFADWGCRVVSATDPYDCILEFFGQEPLIFLPSSSAISLTKLSGPRSRITSQKIWKSREWNPAPLDLYVYNTSITPDPRLSFVKPSRITWEWGSPREREREREESWEVVVRDTTVWRGV